MRARPDPVLLVEGLGVPAWIKSPDGRYLAVTRELAHHVGARRGEMVGRLDAEFWPDPAVSSFRASDNAALARPAGVLVPEPGLTGRDRVTVTAKTAVRAEGELLGTLGFFVEVPAPFPRRDPGPSDQHSPGRLAGVTRKILAALDGPGDRTLAEYEPAPGLAPLPSGGPKWIERLRQTVLERYRERISASVLARDFGVHPGHLGRAFRKAFGQHLSEFIRQRRIDWACMQLVTTSQPVGHIALDAGYYDQSHFARDFRRVTSKTATEYRGAFLKAPR